MNAIGIGSSVGCTTQYALGYALERLGLVDEARQAYQAVLILDGRHRKARERLERLRMRQDVPAVTLDATLPAPLNVEVH